MKPYTTDAAAILGCEPRRGRPAGELTFRRLQVLTVVVAARQEGRSPTFGYIARVCGLHSYRHARRIVRDLERHGLLSMAENLPTERENTIGRRVA